MGDENEGCHKQVLRWLWIKSSGGAQARGVEGETMLLLQS